MRATPNCCVVCDECVVYVHIYLVCWVRCMLTYVRYALYVDVSCVIMLVCALHAFNAMFFAWYVICTVCCMRCMLTYVLYHVFAL